MPRNRVRMNGMAIDGSIRVPKRETRRSATFHDALPAMDRSVMHATQNDQHVRIMITTLDPSLQVMDVKENPLTTTRYDAPSTIAPHHRSSHRRRHVLPSAVRMRAHV